METTIISVDKSMDKQKSYQQAVDLLESGGVVAFPTETVYGLGAIATNDEAVQKIFAAKGRPSDNPLIVHIGNIEEVERYATGVTENAQKLMTAFWPGPLTLVFNKIPGVIAATVTPGVETVGIRMPNHPVALELLRTLEAPLAAPSANRSGKPSPTEAIHVYDDLKGRIPLILDGGQTGVGVESTVIDMTTNPPTILRPGSITQEMIESVIGQVHAGGDSSDKEAPRSPGMKYPHYAPLAPLYIIPQDEGRLNAIVDQLHQEGKKVAVIGPNEWNGSTADWYFAIGAKNDLSAMAANLYGVLRKCDTTEADVILAVETEPTGIGAAVMNRLMKAANGNRYA
ncbi:L-threonylcarbamoyladenylate synthase [Sporosarcina sp. HYO08]|uniref:L-threonylcarbamoyladenylate synthase n=1 Tax=Sporosarcina sp. HYO08 TaxID=1759557 RepID=UPI000793DB16|nr:L-threonylcarbamoyladenylate synthase [Sporosarcina sp. HYO08]KXH83972.1 tRNA threonylcarbamoyladenosine biosynthesis protein [Sporosarcina sp. HYO08]